MTTFTTDTSAQPSITPLAAFVAALRSLIAAHRPRLTDPIALALLAAIDALLAPLLSSTQAPSEAPQPATLAAEWLAMEYVLETGGSALIEAMSALDAGKRHKGEARRRTRQAYRVHDMVSGILKRRLAALSGAEPVAGISATDLKALTEAARLALVRRLREVATLMNLTDDANMLLVAHHLRHVLTVLDEATRTPRASLFADQGGSYLVCSFSGDPRPTGDAPEG